MSPQVVHKWTPNHRDPKLRSHVDKSILLIQIDDKYVPIAENCVQDLGDEVWTLSLAEQGRNPRERSMNFYSIFNMDIYELWQWSLNLICIKIKVNIINLLDKYFIVIRIKYGERKLHLMSIWISWKIACNFQFDSRVACVISVLNYEPYVYESKVYYARLSWNWFLCLLMLLIQFLLAFVVWLMKIK